MSALKLIDFPKRVGRDTYEEALTDAMSKFKEKRGVIAVYQIGSISAPGISDLDVVAVFEDHASADGAIVPSLRTAHPYLFIHDLYGACLTHFREAQKFSFFHNYRLLCGEDVRPEDLAQNAEDEATLKRQIALEYLVKMYINMVLQREYRSIRVRGFLLHVKAVAYDLEFLNVEDGDLYDLTHCFINWRRHWFEDPPSPQAFVTAFERLFAALVSFLREALVDQPFHLPEAEPYRVAKRILLQSGSTLGFRRTGVRLPYALSALGERYTKINNRLSRFCFEVPLADGPAPPVLADRAQFIKEAAQHNRKHLPCFEILTSSL